MFKKIAVSAIAFTFALAVALPASALDREEGKGPKAPQGHVTPQGVTADQAKISVAGHGKADQLRFSQRQVSSQKPAGLFEKAECSFTCGDWLVTCYGEAVGCTDSSCVAIGGGREISAVCVYY